MVVIKSDIALYPDVTPYRYYWCLNREAEWIPAYAYIHTFKNMDKALFFLGLGSGSPVDVHVVGDEIPMPDYVVKGNNELANALRLSYHEREEWIRKQINNIVKSIES